MLISLAPGQLAMLVRAARDQAVFHRHAADQQRSTGYHEFADDDELKAANLGALAEQLEDMLTHTHRKIANTDEPSGEHLSAKPPA